MSRPLQVFVDEDELARLEAWAKRRGWSKSQAVRAALRALTRPRERDPVLELSGMVLDGLPRDASERFDRYMNQTFIAESAPPYRKRRKARRSSVRR